MKSKSGSVPEPTKESFIRIKECVDKLKIKPIKLTYTITKGK